MCIGDLDLPEVGYGGCCLGAAVYGPSRCTCWVPVHDREQATPGTTLTPGTRARLCADCAYRPASPERTGHDRAGHDQSDLDALVYGSGEFWCHQGMRLIVGARHPEGVYVPRPAGEQLDYDPLIVDGVPYRADGRPAERCAGLAAARRHAASVALTPTPQEVR